MQWSDDNERDIGEVGVTRLLEGKVAIVTGGGRGLGQSLCLRLAHEGCRVVVVADLNRESAIETASQIASGRSIPLEVDVTDEDQVAQMVDRAVEECGRLDLMVVNAGIIVTGGISQFPLEAWRRVIDVNLLGYFLCAKHAARIMVSQRSGVIIQINSKSGKKGSYKSSAYAASKFGGIGLTQSTALELAEYGVRVNAVCVGDLLDSPLWQDRLYREHAAKWGITEEEVRQKYIEQVPLKRGCTYDDVANMVAYLASDQASYVTGQSINVTGGQVMH